MLKTVQSIHGETALLRAVQPNVEFPDRPKTDDIYVIAGLLGVLRTTFHPSRGYLCMVATV